MPAKVYTLKFPGSIKEVPSQIAYDHTRKDWLIGNDLKDSIRSAKVPSGTVPEEDIIAMPKLCLDERMHEDIRENVRKQLERVGPLMDAKTGTMRIPTYEDVCREFLKRLYQYAVKKVSGSLSGKFRQEDYRCVLSFPAAWNRETRRKLGDIARDAGLTNVDPISEPEAAVAYITRRQLQERRKLDENSTWSVSNQRCFFCDINADTTKPAEATKPAEKFLLIDAGGGTVVRAYEKTTDMSTPLTITFKGSYRI